MIGAALALIAAPAQAENWVTVYDEDPIWATIDTDSIHGGPDGFVYFQSEGGDRADQAGDCGRGILYTIKIYTMGGIYNPKWKDEGQPIVSGTAGEALLSYACTHH